MTVKVPGKGTKGTPFPKFLAKLGNGFVLRRVKGGGMKGAGGMPVVVLAYEAARRAARIGRSPSATSRSPRTRG